MGSCPSRASETHQLGANKSLARAVCIPRASAAQPRSCCHGCHGWLYSGFVGAPVRRPCLPAIVFEALADRGGRSGGSEAQTDPAWAFFDFRSCRPTAGDLHLINTSLGRKGRMRTTKCCMQSDAARCGVHIFHTSYCQPHHTTEPAAQLACGRKSQTLRLCH